MVRSENGSEFCNRVFSSLLDKFGVHVRHGAVGHPQSQGAAERFNRTLLTLIRKTVQSHDWRVDLDMLLFYYCTRPHSGLGVSPMMAMYGWETRDLIVKSHCPPHERFTAVRHNGRRCSIRTPLDSHTVQMHTWLDSTLSNPFSSAA